MNPRLLFFLCFAVSACSVSAQVGSALLASSSIAASGGRVAIDASESPQLAGTSIDIPAGALSEATEIGAVPGPLLAIGDWIAIGPSVEWVPADLMFANAADYELPASLPPGHDADDIVLLVSGPGGIEAVAGAQLQFDGTLLHFSAPWLGIFQAAVGKPCSNRASCSAGNACIHGSCHPAPDGM